MIASLSVPCAAGDVREALAASATATQAKQQGVEARAALTAAEAVVAKLRQAAEACQADMQQAAKAFNLCNAAADGFQKAAVSSTTSEAAQVRLLHQADSTVSLHLGGSVQEGICTCATASLRQIAVKAPGRRGPLTPKCKHVQSFRRRQAARPGLLAVLHA